LAVASNSYAGLAGSRGDGGLREARGAEGIQVLKDTCDYIYEAASDVPIILDAKRGDIGNTNEGYARMAFDALRVDAITIQPYQGKEAFGPFLSRADKGNIVLCKMSNAGSEEFQSLDVAGKPLYMHVAERVAAEWNTNGNCCLVVGATYPEELEQVRAIASDIPLLIPGVGAQGGDLEATVRAAKGKMFINVSRAVLYASSNPDFAEAARAQALTYDGAIRAVLL
jgi:orotidine-5'-phosphate decarboxylase